jgi:C4-dicarboxylate-specific signal transduction histidine kinase
VFLNLYTNAKQAVNDLKDEKERWIEVVVQLKTNPNILQIVFSNGGPPIPKEHQEKIFETFFTTKNINKGTGLGLSVSRKIISDMGGQLYLNKEAAYPEFIIEFPQKKITTL